MKLLLCVLMTAAAFGQSGARTGKLPKSSYITGDPPSDSMIVEYPAPTAEPPKLTAEQIAKYWRARAEADEAIIQSMRAQIAFQQTQTEMCPAGKLDRGADGNPACVTTTKKVPPAED